MSDIVELVDGKVIYQSYPNVTGIYHRDTLLKIANSSAERRGKTIRVLRSALPKDHPFRDMSNDDLAKVRLKESE